jgi:hypothetical protein
MKAAILLLLGLLLVAGCSASANVDHRGAGASVGVGDDAAGAPANREAPRRY